MIYLANLKNAINESFFTNIDRLAQLHTIPRKVKKRLVIISIELIQNVTKHAALSQSAKLCILKNRKGYCIVATNSILKNEISTLTSVIHKIHALNKQQRKAAYTQILKTTSLSAKGGVGLGLHRIAILASTFTYSIQHINTDSYSISFYVNITA